MVIINGGLVNTFIIKFLILRVLRVRYLWVYERVRWVLLIIVSGVI